MRNKFRIGDKVRTLLPCIIHNTDVMYPTGTTGIIVEICDHPNYTAYLVYFEEYVGSAHYMADNLELVSDFEVDDRPQCCKDRGVYGATCDTCDYGDDDDEDSRTIVHDCCEPISEELIAEINRAIKKAEEDDVPINYEAVRRQVTVEEVERLEEELRCARSEVADLKNLIIKMLFDRYGY